MDPASIRAEVRLLRGGALVASGTLRVLNGGQVFGVRSGTGCGGGGGGRAQPGRRRRRAGPAGWRMVSWALLPPLAALAATAPDLVPVLRFPPRPSAEALRCSGDPIARTETLLWGMENRSADAAPGPHGLELTRLHPDGTSTLLVRQTIGGLAAGETFLIRFPYEVIYCLSGDPRMPWPAGGRFRVSVGSGGAQRSTEASDP